MSPRRRAADTSALPREIWVDDQRIRVEIRPGEGPPLLMCNGIGAPLDLLTPFVDNLDPTIPVIRFDVPGVGGSPLPQRPYCFASLVVMLGRMLDKLGETGQVNTERVDVLGISWGGGLAQQIALQMPRRCRRLVLVATGTGAMMVPAKPPVLAKMITPRRYRDPSYAARIAPELYGGALRRDPDAVRVLLDSHSQQGSRRGYFLQLLAAAGWASLPFLPLLRQETLILAGRDDPIIPLTNARIMKQAIRHSELYVYDDGHLGLMTSAGELGAVVGAFLRPTD